MPQISDNHLTYSMRGENKMTVKEKLIFFSEHGFSMSYLARRMGIDPSTLTKWIKEQKGITHKNENKIEETLRQLAEELYNISR